MVVGAGAAGIAAAVAAADSGLQVVLIDRNSVPGGLATNAEVGTVCGLYRYDSSPQFAYNVGRFACEFAMELQVRSGRDPQMDRTGLKFLPFSPDAFRMLGEELLAEKGVKRIQAELVGVETSGNTICSLEFATETGNEQVEVAAVIDASGVSRVSKILGLELIETGFRQSASQVFTVKNVPFHEESNLSLVLLKALRKGVLSGRLEEVEDRLYLVPGSLDAERVSLKVTIPAPFEQEMNKRELRAKALEVIKHILDYLRSEEPAFERLELDSVAPEVGVRVGDRPVGVQVLGDEDVLECVHSEHSVARGNWPMEIWSQDKRVELHHLKESEYYDIPAGVLLSKTVENLYFAGRCISATDRAIASARVIGTCLQTGYAAGMLAAGYVSGKSLEETIKRIQSEQFGANEK